MEDATVDGTEPIGTAREALEGQNALGVNALGVNALGVNALGVNALGVNALGVNALGVNSLNGDALATLQDPGETGTLFRELVKYTVGCALTPSQSFSFSWQDASGVSHDESYPGALGLATSWTSGPLDATGQRVISACLAARTNYFQVPVTISLRSSYAVLSESTSGSEIAAYPYVEGAFWGNLFAATPYLNACYKVWNEAHSRAAQRDCATGYPAPDGTVVPCGMIALQGSCSEVCGYLDESDGYYPSCLDQPGSGSSAQTSLAITTALP